MSNTWTKGQLKILKNNYASKGAKYIVKRTGHSFNSVTAKARALGLKSGSIRRWRQFDLNYLNNNYAIKPLDSIARTLKRSTLSVAFKVRQLNLPIPKKPKRWSEEDISLLRELWCDKKYSIDEVAAKLNKTRPATHFQAWKMGLRRPQVWRFWKEEETKYLKKNFMKKSYKEIAKDLGVSVPSVTQKARKLGLKSRPSPRPWTAADDEYIRQNYRKIPTREIAEKLDRSLDTIINRAGPLGISRKKVKK